mgnify:CR=1 FL=1
MKMKKVVFAIPMYNASSHLPDLVSSLKDQTNENWEAVIVNDMSNDDTLEIANNIAESDDRERVTVINHKEKKFALKGICDYLSNYNDFSQQIIAILDGDDGQGQVVAARALELAMSKARATLSDMPFLVSLCLFSFFLLHWFIIVSCCLHFSSFIVFVCW